MKARFATMSGRRFGKLEQSIIETIKQMGCEGKIELWAPDYQRLLDAAEDFCQSTESECGHDPEWKALSKAISELKE